ncbi:hypothetical protein EG359_06430 [Chryseobacterium joostei]|uniref:Uncharacterized protein n=1 Tax=Chryseobacterium joostei TaxID=112234 RepID=A0A1N7HSB8_9FLAO|nr:MULTISPECIES: hypothetical protein [Chryseobacterium]AZA99263.1 hypothetical protein EG359_06430 [Chryseobacterium joostei]SIS27774.1 hypothetical protein SAMN05421768_10170 [Chryseobacterium joostei]
MNNVVKLTRTELYDKVWATPLTTLSKEFNLSDNGLRKICIKFDIPLPPMGYWQKLQFGKKVVQIPLPQQENEEEVKIYVDQNKNEPNPINSLRQIVTEKIKKNSALILKVSERLSKPDEITSKVQENLSKKKVNDYAKIKGTIDTDGGLPNIVVSPKNVSRALRILDNLIKNFKILGYKMNIDSEGLKFAAYEDKITLYIKEKSNIKDTTNERGWKSRDLIANGMLAVKIVQYGTTEFADTDKLLVEDQIEKILIKVETEFQRMAENRRKWKIESEKREELRKIEEAKQKMKDEELAKFIAFYNDAHRWKKFIILKEYFEYMKSHNTTNKEWIEWAEKKLDWYDPAKNTEDGLMDNVDKNTLEAKEKKRWDW